MRKTFVLLAAFLAAPGLAQQEQPPFVETLQEQPSFIEKWKCMAHEVWLTAQLNEWGYEDVPDDKVLVTLSRDSARRHMSNKHNKVSIAGITHIAYFSVEGLERRWTFGVSRQYAFVIDVQGGGWYYSAGGKDLHFGCLSTREPETSAAETENVSIAPLRPLVRVDPQWPPRALQNGIEGHVLFELLIGTDGSVLDARVIESVPGEIFVRKAERAVRRWKFSPWVVDGVPMRGLTQARIAFELGE